ncbi:hypothetical protein V6O07_08885, partial [Arthrospira platensis SPKY2]
MTVTTAVLLDTFLNIFGREEMLTSIGSFIYAINGALFMGGLIWLWGVLRPALRGAESGGQLVQSPRAVAPVSESKAENKKRPLKDRVQNIDTAFDRQMLYEQMRYRLSPSDLRN